MMFRDFQRDHISLSEAISSSPPVILVDCFELCEKLLLRVLLAVALPVVFATVFMIVIVSKFIVKTSSFDPGPPKPVQVEDTSVCQADQKICVAVDRTFIMKVSNFAKVSSSYCITAGQPIQCTDVPIIGYRRTNMIGQCTYREVPPIN